MEFEARSAAPESWWVRYLYNMLLYTQKASGRTHEKLLALTPPRMNKTLHQGRRGAARTNWCLNLYLVSFHLWGTVNKSLCLSGPLFSPSVKWVNL